MTAIYETLNAKGYEIINTVHGYDDDEVLRNLRGPSRKHDWKPILVQRDQPGRRSRAKEADIPYAHDFLVLRHSAVEALRDLLEAHGEILSLATTDGVELFVFNPRFIIDAIDKERSSYERIPNTDVIVINKYEFIDDVVRDIDIFQVPFGPRMSYYSDRFVERVQKAKLKGTEFTRLWSNNGSPTKTFWVKPA